MYSRMSSGSSQDGVFSTLKSSGDDSQQTVWETAVTKSCLMNTFAHQRPRPGALRQPGQRAFQLPVRGESHKRGEALSAPQFFESCQLLSKRRR